MKVRNTYTDPLHYLQAELLHRDREAEGSGAGKCGKGSEGDNGGHCGGYAQYRMTAGDEPARGLAV